MENFLLIAAILVGLLLLYCRWFFVRRFAEFRKGFFSDNGGSECPYDCGNSKKI